MGFRFRKSIKLAPGVRLNLSKTGVSASAGMPGGGLYYTTRHTGGGARESSRPTKALAGSALAAAGERLAGQWRDSSVLRDGPPVLNEEALRMMYEPGARAEAAKAHRVKPWLPFLAFGIGAVVGCAGVYAAVAQVHNEMLRLGLSYLAVFTPLGAPLLVGIWDMVRVSRAKDDAVKAGWPAFLEQSRHMFEASKADWERLSRPDVSADEVAESVELQLEIIDFPFETSTQIAVPDVSTVYALVDLPEIEDLFDDVRPARRRNELYAQTVCGMAYQVARECFAGAPSVRSVTVAGFTQRRATDGSLRDEFVVELTQERASSAAMDFDEIDPVQTLTKDAGARIKLTKTMKLSRIPAPPWSQSEMA